MDQKSSGDASNTNTALIPTVHLHLSSVKDVFTKDNTV
jgi:hypothetical protein